MASIRNKPDVYGSIGSDYENSINQVDTFE